MKNRAKCKLCGSVIESFHPYDHVICKCGEIELNGGDALFAKARDFANFLRVDDHGNEIVVKYTEPNSNHESDNQDNQFKEDIGKKELIELIEKMMKDDEQLPSHVKSQPLYYYDLQRYMLVILNLFKRLS